jgi:hypothetical protein
MNAAIKQTEMFNAPKGKKKMMTPDLRALVEMYNTCPTLVVGRPARSQQKGYSDLPLFEPQNQTQMF